MGWIYRSLPLLGVNRNITADWRWLPWEYQGLGLPNMGLEKGADMIEYVVRQWDSEEGMGVRLRRSFEIAQLECGLQGNFLQRSYVHYGCLSSHSWFKLLWNYVDYYKVTLKLEDIDVALPRERDKVFMELAVSLIPQEDWVRVNRVRHHKRARIQEAITGALARSKKVKVILKQLQCWDSAPKYALLGVNNGLDSMGFEITLAHHLKLIEKKLCRMGKLSMEDY